MPVSFFMYIRNIARYNFVMENPQNTDSGTLGFQYIKITGILEELKRHAGSSTPCGESIKQRKCHMFVQNHVTLDQ